MEKALGPNHPEVVKFRNNLAELHKTQGQYAKAKEDLTENEKKAEIAHPQKLVREKFQLLFPSNWKVDVKDKDYDPDQMFSIDSPGNAFVMFVMGNVETKPEETLKDQISRLRKLLGEPKIDKFEKYGKFSGKGATLQGKIMGIRMTVKVFSFYQDGFTVIITQQCPDEDMKDVQDGLTLIENSFTLKSP